MKMLLQKAKLERGSRSPLEEREFLKLYSAWHETHDESIRRRLFMSFGRLMKSDPGFDFRQQIWQAV